MASTNTSYELKRNDLVNLLVNLKQTVEVLLGNHTTNVWNTYGGLSRLTNVVSNILQHNLNKEQGITDYWNFILGLRVLMPTVAPWLERHRLSTERGANRSYSWIQQRLQEHTLSSYLTILIDDNNHLKACYKDDAFLRQREYANALLICLRAVENNNLTLLAELDSSLLVEKTSLSWRNKGHVRSSSLPTIVPETVEEKGQKSEFRDKTRELRTCCPLRRRQPVDSSKALYYRTKCYEHALAKCEYHDFERQLGRSLIPQSNTWDSGLSWASLLPNSDPRTSSPVPRYIPPIKTADNCCFANKRLRQSKSEPILSRGDSHMTIRPFRSLTSVVAQQIVVVAKPEYPTPNLNIVKVYSADTMPGISGAIDVSAVGYRRNYKSETKNQPPHRSPSHSRSKSDVTGAIAKFADPGSSPRGAKSKHKSGCSIPMSSSLPANLQDEAGPVIPTEDYPAPIFRRPVEGQSLTSFLSSQDFKTCAELDKENAHFSISEALISAIEQIKCNQMLKIAEEEDQESDDEEIKHLKQRIRIRRRERLQEKVVLRGPHLLSDGRTDTTTTSQSPSPRSSSSECKSAENTSDSVDHIDLSDGSEVDCKLSTLNESGLSLSMASLYSDADILKPPPVASPLPVASVSQDPQQTQHQEVTSAAQKSASLTESTSSVLSAESVALSLLKKFSEKQLPKASDLEWLVSEQEAPQKLLPLPTSWPVSPDDAENVQQTLHTRLRGNLEWAPPRQQIIFNVHPAPQRKVIMARQNYRCTGCGTKVEQGFMKRFRYCEYLGKYFCQCCHNNNLAYIPGRILRKWDFNKYYVSNFSRDLLNKMADDPFYDISHINPSLYLRVKALNQVLQYRLQLFYIKDFIRVCRNCASLAEELQQQPKHLLEYAHMYSLNELVQVQSGEMLKRFKPLVSKTLAHVAQCQLCQARGFFCEFCKNDQEIIFPFQLGKVVQCPLCWTCYHTECFVPEKCPKCARIETRRQRLLEDDGDTD